MKATPRSCWRGRAAAAMALFMQAGGQPAYYATMEKVGAIATDIKTLMTDMNLPIAEADRLITAMSSG